MSHSRSKGKTRIARGPDDKPLRCGCRAKLLEELNPDGTTKRTYCSSSRCPHKSNGTPVQVERCRAGGRKVPVRNERLK